MVDLDVSLETKKKAYREDFVTKPRLSTAHLLDWLAQREKQTMELAQGSGDPNFSFGHSRESKGYREVLQHIQTMSN